MYTIVTIIVVIFMYLRSHHLFSRLYTEEKQVILWTQSSGEIGILECKSAGLDHSVFNHQVEHKRSRRAVGDRLSGLLEG